MEEFPSDLKNAIRKINSGQVKVDLTHKGVDPVIRTLQRITKQLITTFIMVALIIGASLFIVFEITWFKVYWFLSLLFFGFFVSWFLGFLVSKFLGFLVSRFLMFGFLVSWFLGFLVSLFLGFKVPKFSRFKDSKIL